MPPAAKRRRTVARARDSPGTPHSQASTASPGPVHSDDDEGEDLLDGNALQNDYRAIPELDRYDNRDLDDRAYSDIDYDGRAAADAILDAREQQNGGTRRRGRLPAALQDMAEDFRSEGDAAYSRDDFSQNEDARQNRLQQLQEDAAAGAFGGMGAEGFDDTQDEPFDLSQCEGFVKDWILKERPRREVKRRFRQFLHETHDEKMKLIYLERIQAMCTANKQSLEVSYVDLSQQKAQMAIWLADAPREMIELFDEVAKEEVLKQFPNYEDTHSTIHVRITHLPICDSIRDLRQIHTNALVKVAGVVTRRTGVFPQLTLTKYKCVKCSFVLGPFPQNDTKELKIGSCPECQSKGPFLVDTAKTLFRNYQKISLQESPGTVPAGRVPRYKEVILTNDLIDKARPGEEIEVTGTYSNNFDLGLNVKQGFPVFSTMVEANYVLRKENQDVAVTLTDDDRSAILQLSKDPRIAERIILSIAPSIFGQETVKTAIAVSLFGGREKNINNKHRIRGDINVLLLGDPGTAKSQVLKYIEQTAPRAVYTTGKGASAVGLTAAVHKDPITGEWTLEGGALVLADRGVCMIDEFDKMNDADRTSIHEAMEQQSISISKAGIVTTLQARCAVIAAANPINGKYDPSRTLAENVELTDPILQRFDVLCVLQDTVDPVLDERLARFVTGSHMKSVPYDEYIAVEDMPEDGGATKEEETETDKEAAALAADQIPQELLRKYLWYARTQCRPALHDVNKDKIIALYAELRQQSNRSGGVPIAVRHIESIIRISEAHARMHLRDHVREDDVNMGIRVLLDSFINAQKNAVMKTMRAKFRKYLVYNRDNNTLLMHELEQMMREAQVQQSRLDDDDTEFRATTVLRVSIDDFQRRAERLEIYKTDAFFSSIDFNRIYTIDESGKMIEKPF